jgi:hypothetical protein
VELKVIVLIHSLPDSGAVVAGSEYQQFESRRSSRGDAASKAASPLPESACHAATGALQPLEQPLEQLLAGELFLSVSGSEMGVGDLENSVRSRKGIKS